LGLAIARQLVALHGGTIEAESAGEGKGATFRVRIPLRVATEDTRAHEAREGSASEELTPLSGLRVLVVDDEPDTCDVLEAVLREAGAEVRACESAAEALAELDTWWPDVLLSDIGMPGEDGYSLIRRVRAQEARYGRAIAAGPAAIAACVAGLALLLAPPAGGAERMPVVPEQLAFTRSIDVQDEDEFQTSLSAGHLRLPHERGTTVRAEVEYGVTDRVQAIVELPYGVRDL